MTSEGQLGLVSEQFGRCKLHLILERRGWCHMLGQTLRVELDVTYKLRDLSNRGSSYYCVNSLCPVSTAIVIVPTIEHSLQLQIYFYGFRISHMLERRFNESCRQLYE